MRHYTDYCDVWNITVIIVMHETLQWSLWSVKHYSNHCDVWNITVMILNISGCQPKISNLCPISMAHFIIYFSYFYHHFIVTCNIITYICILSTHIHKICLCILLIIALSCDIFIAIHHDNTFSFIFCNFWPGENVIGENIELWLLLSMCVHVPIGYISFSCFHLIRSHMFPVYLWNFLSYFLLSVFSE